MSSENVQQFWESEWGTVAYRHRAGKTLLVFLHGLCADSHFFNPLCAAVEEKGFGFLCLDIPGFGGSRLKDPAKGDLSSFAKPVAACIEEVSAAATETVLCCHSMSTVLFHGECEKLSACVDALVCLEGNVLAEDTVHSSSYANMSLAQLEQNLGRKKRVAPTIVRTLLNQTPRPEVFDKLVEGYRSTDAVALHLLCKELVKHTQSGDLLRSIAEFSGKKHYLAGQLSNARASLEQMESLEVFDSVVSFPEAGHELMLDVPPQLASWFATVFFDKLGWPSPQPFSPTWEKKS